MKNNKYLIFLLLVLTFCQNLFSINGNHPIGARSSGISGSSVTLTDLWSAGNNQAGLAYLTHFTVGVGYENKFILPELSLKSIALALPTKSGVFALSCTYFGYSKYNESNFGLSYAKTLGKYFSMGIRLDYLYTHIAQEYGNTGTFAGEIGIRAQPIKNLFIGAHIFNPTRSKITDYNNEKIPTILKFGIAYNFSDKVYLSTETEKDIENKAIFKVGFEYHIIDNLYLRSGISINSLQTSFGVGYVFNNLKIDISFTTHQELGITPNVSLLYEFK